MVWELVKGAKKVCIAAGKKVNVYSPEPDREEILERMRGRTGNLRAPSLRKGETFYIGYNEAIYQDIVKSA